MSQFTIQLTRAAARDLDQLASSDRDQVTHALEALKGAPIGRPPRIKRLRGFSYPLYRLRCGDYRILYRVDNRVVTVMRVINRRDFERTLRQFR